MNPFALDLCDPSKLELQIHMGWEVHMTKTTMKEILAATGKVLVVYAAVGAVVVEGIAKVKKLTELIEK